MNRKLHRSIARAALAPALLLGALGLGARAADAPPPAEQLQAIGRGPQLRTPPRLEALVKGQTHAAEAKTAATPAAVGETVTASADLEAGPVRLAVKAVYDGGAVAITVTPPGAIELDGLRLVLPLAGPVDMVIPFSALPATLADLPPGSFTPASHDGVAWSNLKGNGSQGVLTAPGPIRFLFVGNGDRGVCVEAPASDQWPLDAAQPTAELVRDGAGQSELHLWLANRPATLEPKRPFAFTLRFLPDAAGAGRRRAGLAAWQTAPNAAQTSANLLKTPPADAFLRVEGTAGGDALSSDKTLADSCPIELFRYLAGCPAGVPAQLRTNASALVRPGMSPAADRMAVGRALLHDMGVDAGGIAHHVLLLRAVAALERFGVLRDPARAEFLPYWRSADVVRYGQPAETAGAFAADSEDPVGRVYVSAYIRPADGATRGERQALFIVVNESDKPLRELFYVHKPARVFGGPNRARALSQVARWDFSSIPADSDWNRPRLENSAVRASRGQDAGRPESQAELHDFEDDGFVAQAGAKDGFEVYGPLFLPARGYRILYGSGIPTPRK